MAEPPRRGNPPSQRDQEYRAEQEQAPVADQNGTRFPVSLAINRVHMTSDMRRLIGPIDVRVPLNTRPGWDTSADGRSYADLLLDSLSLDEQSHDRGETRQGAEPQDPRLDEWRRNSLNAEEYIRIERESRPERVARALRRATRERYWRSDTSEEAAEEATEEQQTSTHPTVARE